MFSAKVVIFVAAVAVCYGAPNAKLSNKHLRIDGGVNAKVEDYPFAASIQLCLLHCEHICGGVIISDKWVLTGAGCVSDSRGDNLMVAVGATNLRAADTVTVYLEAAFTHPDYSPIGVGPNDLALLKLDEPLTFSDKVQAAKLPKQGQEFNGTAVVTGYGGTNEDPGNFQTLQAVLDLALISNNDCNNTIAELYPDLGYSPLDYDSNICTLNKVSNTCYGDIGGPLSQDGTVIGTITWFFNPCGTSGAPNIFTKLSNFADWINQTITENS